MFGSTSKVTPQQEVDWLVNELRDTRTAYDNATDEKWREQHRATIGIRLSALVRATRKLVNSDIAATQSTGPNDAQRCNDLEARAGKYLNSATSIATLSSNDWPNDLRREIEAQSVELIESADKMLDEVRAIVTRYTSR